MDPLMWTYMRSTQNWPKTLNWKAYNFNPNKPWILTESKVLIKPKQGCIAPLLHMDKMY